MAEFQVPAWLKEWFVIQVKSSSNYSGLGMSAGGIFALIAKLRGAEPWGWFFVGFTIAPGLAAFLYSTDFMFERRLRHLKRWLDDGSINEEQFESQRQQAMDWRAARLYGVATKPLSRPKTKPKPKVDARTTEQAESIASESPSDPTA